MSFDTIYRTAQPTDAPRIAAQGREAFLQTFSNVYAPEEIDGYFASTYGPGLQDREIADSKVQIFLAEDEHGLLGHLKLGPCALPVPDLENSAEVKRFYLLARAQGTGVAQAMLTQAVEVARSHASRNLYLSCWTENERAVRFYQRESFTIVGRNSFQVGPRIDTDYIMQRSL